jgi:hypothetical protein
MCIQNFNRKPEEREQFEDLSIDARIILRLILKKYIWMWSGFIWLGTGSSGELL